MPGDSATMPGAPAPGDPPLPDAPFVRDWMVVDDPVARHARRGLTVWFFALILLGIAGVATGQTETAALVVLGTLFAAAHAAEADRRSRLSYQLVAWIVPLVAFLAFAGLTWVVFQSEMTGVARAIAVGSSLLALTAATASMIPGSGPLLCRLFFGDQPPTAPLRLAARLVLYGLVLALPAWFGFETMREEVLERPETLLDPSHLSGGLIGYVLLAAGGVGWLTRRTLAETLERLGVRPLGLRDLLLVLGGVVALIAINAGGDALQHRLFPALWERDHAFTQALAKNLKPAQTLLLGLSAGVGEEITLRGALQPRLGLVLTSLLFSVLHIQYSWFGMGMILVLGLTLGWIRQRSSTSVAILVHAIYDVLAVFGE